MGYAKLITLHLTATGRLKRTFVQPGTGNGRGGSSLPRVTSPYKTLHFSVAAAMRESLQPDVEFCFVLPENKVFGLLRYGHLWRKDQRFSPVHHFSVRFLRGLGAKWRVTCRTAQFRTVSVCPLPDGRPTRPHTASVCLYRSASRT